MLIVEDWPEIRKAASLVQASISKIACLGNTRKAALTSGEPPSNSRPPAGRSWPTSGHQTRSSPKGLRPTESLNQHPFAKSTRCRG